ncbi:MAG: DUF5320 domain-containing protein [Candidatus Aminicenantales bacterium]
MPAGDRTGPWGFGPRTGRGMGYCAGYPAPGYMHPGPRFGFGRGFGRGLGRGLGRGFGPGRGRGLWNPWFGRLRGFPYFPAAPYPYSPGAGSYFTVPPPYYGRPLDPVSSGL